MEEKVSDENKVLSTNQDISKKTFPYLNPTGKGGFGDNPQNRSDGRWSKEHSQSYLLNKFLRMSVKEIEEWLDNNPKDKRTMAEHIAFARVIKMRNDLREYEVGINRAEGKPKENIDMTSGGEPINSNVIVFQEFKDEADSK